jgi:hypothetical protein
MHKTNRSEKLRKRAKEVQSSYRLADGLYIVGSLERGVTVYKQQVRAHNLVWALSELNEIEKRKINHVAIVGGGISGLTTAACFLSLFENGSAKLFEQRWDLCPLQQGADNRWLHPRIYEWPSMGSRAPGASLPVLNWTEGRASDVARTVIDKFTRFRNSVGKRLEVILGLGHLRISASARRIEWIGNRSNLTGTHFDAEGGSSTFDAIFLTCGFGLERELPDYPTHSYWRNEHFGQPVLDGTRQSFIISGCGDGALTDLCRMTIERFRQDTIVYELFEEQLEQVEERFSAELENLDQNANLYNFFRSHEVLLKNAQANLAKRIRKDTYVLLHIGGERNETKSVEPAFGPHSSFLNRLLLYLLYQCGAFGISLQTLPAAVRRFGVPISNVICRHGVNTHEHLQDLFVDFDSIADRLDLLKQHQPQKAQRLWEPGAFPMLN